MMAPGSIPIPRGHGNRRRGRAVGAVVAAASIASMAVVLAVVLAETGLLDAVDGGVRHRFAALAGTNGLALWPLWPLWPVMALALFGLIWAMIESPGLWRRLVLGISGGAVILAVTPVAALAGGWLPPSPLVVGWLWSGVWAIVYGIRHEAELAQARRQRVRPAAGDLP